MKKPLILYFFSLFFQIFSQEEEKRCATTIYEKTHLNTPKHNASRIDFEVNIQKMIAARKQFKTTSYPVVTIPVVVHVIHNNQPLGLNQNISEATILSQIEILNQDYRRQNTDANLTANEFIPVAADANIQFCLATVDTNCNPTSGIVRVSNSQATFSLNDIDYLKSLSYWPSDKYLNLWVVDLESPYLGLAVFPYVPSLVGLEDSSSSTYPNIDGVVIDYKAFGNTGSSLSKIYKLGRTATHEIGHWLGLIHTFGDAYCGDDYCNDTPRVPSESGTDECNRVVNCDNTGPTMIENYMDYSYDECMNMFSEDQVDRMRAALSLSKQRSNLINNNVCSYVAEKNYTPTFENFEENPISNYLILPRNSTINPEGSYGSSKYSLASNTSSSDTLFSTQILNLDSLGINYLSFDMAVLNGGNTTLNGTIIFEYSAGCSNKWTSFITLPIAQFLNSSNLNQTNPSNGDWLTKVFSLANIKKNYIKLRLLYQNLNGQNTSFFIDNINFTDNIKTNLDIHYNYKTQELEIDPQYIGTKNIDYIIYNTNGKLICTGTYFNANAERINLGKLLQVNELYLVKASVDNQNFYYKFVNLVP